MTLSEWLAKKIQTAKKSQAKAHKNLSNINPEQDRDSFEYYVEGIAYNEGIEDTCKQLAEKFPARNFDLNFISNSLFSPN